MQRASFRERHHRPVRHVADCAGNVWSLSSGAPLINNNLAGILTNSTKLLLEYTGSLYLEDSTGAWWQWNTDNTGWLQMTGDPRTGGTVATAGSGGTGITSSGGVTRFYSPQSFWNEPVPSNPSIDPNSAAIVATSIVPHAGSSNFSNGDDFGVSLIDASASNQIYNVACTLYYCGQQPAVSFPIPQGALPTTGSDHHLVVVNGNQELDMWDASNSGNSWSAGSRFIENLYGWGANAAPGQRAGGMFAAGYSGMGGVVRPEEIAQGHIDHALSLMIPAPGPGPVGLATATDGRGTGPNTLPEGAHIQLDPSFNVAAQNWPAWEKTIAVALQTYGAYVSDTGGSMAFYGQTDMNAGNMLWTTAGAPKDASLSNLPWSSMRVLNLSTVPVDTVSSR